jgi:hypothetical protein
MRAKTLELARAENAKAELLKQVGDLDGVQLPNDLVLLATYIEPERTKGGILIPQKSLDESRFQGKAALLLKRGPTAFQFYDGGYAWQGPVPAEGDWVIFRFSDAWETFIRGVSCRIVESEFIKAVIDDPTMVY